MSSNVEPIGPPWRDGQHCRHCHPQCDGRYDPHDGGVYHEVGEAFTWHPEYGCPVCRNAALLRGMAAEADEQAQKACDNYQALHLQAHWDYYLERCAVATGLRNAADRIERGEA